LISRESSVDNPSFEGCEVLEMAKWHLLAEVEECERRLKELWRAIELLKRQREELWREQVGKTR